MNLKVFPIVLMAFLFMGVGITQVRILDPVVSNGDEVEIFSVVRNFDSGSAKDVRVMIDFPELGIRMFDPRFDVSGDYHSHRFGYHTFEDVEPGWYTVRITASNDEGTSRKFRHIWVE